jgi:hypothetical protein
MNETMNFDSGDNDKDDREFQGYMTFEDFEHVNLDMSRNMNLTVNQSSAKSLRRKLKKIRKQTARMFDNLDRELSDFGDIQVDFEM